LNVSVYSAELLLEKVPPLDADLFLPALRKHCGRVDFVGGEDESKALLFAFPDHESEYEDGNKMLAQVALIVRPAPIEKDDLLPVIQQSWLWQDCESAVVKHTSVLFITDLFAALLDRKVRLALFKNVVRAVLEVVPALALKWTASQQLILPAMYLEKDDAHDDLLFPAINVRMFKVKTGDAIELVMDTVGLEIFDLPDFQCQYKGLEPQEVAAALYDAAYYVFENGDVIKDGETIQGLVADENWLCHESQALAAPPRRVFGLNMAPAAKK
jgi:Domain of unknown function (DUF4261)